MAATPDIPFDNLIEHIPKDGFPHTPRNMDCPCEPNLVVVPYIGAGLIHHRVSIPDSYPDDWNV